MFCATVAEHSRLERDAAVGRGRFIFAYFYFTREFIYCSRYLFARLSPISDSALFVRIGVFYVASRRGDATGTGQADDFIRRQRFDKRVDFRSVAADFDEKRFWRDVDDLRAENFDQFENFAPLAPLRLDANQRQVALDVFDAGKIDGFNDGNELLQLTLHLSHQLFVDVQDDRHPRKTRVFRRADR